MSQSQQSSLKFKRQSGMSFIGVFVIMAVVAFLGLFAFKVGPSYLEYMTVSSIADRIADDGDLMKQPKSKVMHAVVQAYRANSLWELKPEESIFLTKDAAKGYTVKIDYEKRANLLSNVFVVTKFDKVAGTP